MKQNPDIVETRRKGKLTAKMVKQLRNETGAGLLECKKALEMSKLDFEKAKRLLKGPDDEEDLEPA